MLRSTRVFAIAGLAIALAAGTAQAGDVAVKGVHLCCGACVAGANKALKDIDGVTKTAADRNGRLVTFKAKDAKAAAAGIAALAKGGFFGTASHDGKLIKFPDSGAKKGTLSDTVAIGGVHLCCGACVTGAQKALENLKNVKSIDIDRKLRTITLHGAKIDELAVVSALNRGGFYASILKPQPKKK